MYNDVLNITNNFCTIFSDIFIIGLFGYKFLHFCTLYNRLWLFYANKIYITKKWCCLTSIQQHFCYLCREQVYKSQINYLRTSSHLREMCECDILPCSSFRPHTKFIINLYNSILISINNNNNNIIKYYKLVFHEKHFILKEI